MASFDGVLFGSFVAQLYKRHQILLFWSVWGAGLPRESVVIGRRPDNVHDVWHSWLSTSKHSNTPCLRHIDGIFIGQLKFVNLFSNLVLLQLFYKYTCIVGSIYLMDHCRHLRNSPLRLDCCTQGLILFTRSNTKHANRTPCQAYIRLKVDVMSRSICDVTLKCIG